MVFVIFKCIYETWDVNVNVNVNVKKRNINEWNKLKIHMKLNIQMLKRQFKFIFT